MCQLLAGLQHLLLHSGLEIYFQVNMDGERNDGTAGQYDQICYARLPRGLDPHSVPSEELGASLG